MRGSSRDQFRTVVSASSSDEKIDYSTPVMFVGSCFSNEMAGKMKEGKMNVLSNPFGTVYNPFSTATTIKAILEKKRYTEEDLYFHNGLYLSFDHYTTFSSEDQGAVLEAINNKVTEASSFLSRATHLFITFGTARIYRRRDNKSVVSNCHRIPSSFFISELSTPQDIVSEWKLLLDLLHKRYPAMKIWFTVSPVRHWKDGAHGNQVSKSVLHLAIEELMSHKAVAGYFPSYEIVIDDLRDYRFYAEDMIHPSAAAIDYIWGKFGESFLSSPTIRKWEEVNTVLKAVSHRPMGNSGKSLKIFAGTMLSRLEVMANKYPDISFVEEIRYFRNLI